MLTRKASTYFLATPLGKKQSPSVPMAGEKVDPSKVYASSTISVNYEELPEERRQEFEAKLKWQNDEMKARLLSCYGKARQGVVEKEKFVMPTFPSTTSPTSHVINVSSSPQDLYSVLMSDLGKKIDASHQYTQDSNLDLTERIDKFDKG